MEGADNHHHHHHDHGEGEAIDGATNGPGGERIKSRKRSSDEVASSADGPDEEVYSGGGGGRGKGGNKGPNKKRKTDGGGRGGGRGGGGENRKEGGRGAGAASSKKRSRPGGSGEAALHAAPESLRPGTNVPSNVIIARISSVQYQVTVDALNTIFGHFGRVEKIVLFNKGAGEQALVQYPDLASAKAAYDNLDNRCMYTDCNLLRVGYSNLTNLIVKANNDRTWDYTKAEKAVAGEEGVSGENGDNGAAVSEVQPPGTAPPAPPVDSGLKASLRERIISEMPVAWNQKMPGADTSVLLVQGVNMEMVMAETLAALFGVYGDVIKVKMLETSSAALVQMANIVQAYCARWLLDASPLAGNIIKVKPSMQETIRDTQAKDFAHVHGHGYRTVQSPRDPVYLANLVEPTNTLRISGLDWDQNEERFREMLTEHGNIVGVHRVTSGNDSPALLSFATVEDAVHACILMHNLDVNGNLLYVTFSDALAGL